MRRLVAMMVVALALLAGCAFQKAIDNGNLLVQQRAYRAALTEYQHALALDPDSAEARRLVAQITPYALDEAEADVTAELAVGRYEAAARDAAYVARLDAKRGDKQRSRVATAMRTHVEALMTQRKMGTAYPLAVRMAKLFGAMHGLKTVFTRLRGHYYARSERLAAAGKFRKALGALDVIAKHEPAMRPHLKKRRAKIRTQWADRVVARATAKETADELGAAAVLYARAFEIAGRAADGDAMRRLVRRLKSDGRFLLATEYVGDASRRKAIRKLALPHLKSVEGLALVRDEEGASMLASISSGPASCGERYTTSTASKDYVAGTKQVPNPEYATLTAQIQHANTQVNVLSNKVKRLTQRLRRRNKRLRQCRKKGTPTAPAICNSEEQAVKDTTRALDARNGELDEWEAELTSLSSARAATPQTLTEDIIETFHYEVRHHTRSCGVKLSVDLEPAWMGTEKHAVTARRATEDTSHGGYPHYGIATDPLHYPLADGSLVHSADRAAAKQLATLIGGKVRNYYRSMTDRAVKLEGTDRATAVDMMVAILAAGRTHLDKARAQRIQRRLRKLYGLASIATLRS